MAADLTIATISDGAANTAATLMTQLNAIVTWLNTNAVHLDGTKAMTGRLSSPDTDPVSNNEFARKTYADNANTTEVAARGVGDDFTPKVGCSVSCSQSVPDTTLTTLTWSTEVYDTDGFITAPSSTITIPAGMGGVYLVRISGSLSGPTWQSDIYIGGVFSRTLTREGTVFLLSAGNAITVNIRQFTGSTVTVTGTIVVERLSA
jgi:hypothetical protein